MNRRPEPGTSSPLSRGEWVAGWTILAVAVVVATLLPERDAVRYGLAGVVAVLLGYAAVRSPREALRLLVVWLALLGTTRRVVSEFVADPGKDPLLVVAPVASAVLCGRALADGAWRARGWLANGVAGFSVLVVVAVLNPRQGGLLVGLAGLLVWLAPMLYFWIGRRYVDARLATRVLGVVGLLGIAASVYGLWQFGVGFPPWDRRWIDVRGYAALFIGPETVRPFGFSSSASEFAIVVAVGSLWAALVAARAWRRGRRAVAALATAGAAVAALALVVSTVRVTLVLYSVAVLVVLSLGLRRRRWLPVAIAVAVVGMAMVAVQPVDVESLPRDGASASIRRLVAFLQSPLGGQYEVTTDAHISQAREGVAAGFRRPLGLGTGATGRGAERFGDDGRVRDREFDVANAGEAFGVLGMAFVVGLTVVVFATALRRARRRPDLVHLAVVGLAVISFGNWWDGGHYFASALLWLFVGWLDAPGPVRRATSSEARHAPVPAGSG